MGSGKAEEIEKFVKETNEIEEIIVDEHKFHSIESNLHYI